MRALVTLLALALLPAAAALPVSPLVAAGPGYGTLTQGDTFCHGPLVAHVSYMPDGAAMAGLSWAGSGSPDCAAPLQNFGMHALGTLHYDLGEPSVEMTFSCAGTAAAGVTCGAFEVGPYGGPAGWTWVRAPGFEGWFFG